MPLCKGLKGLPHGNAKHLEHKSFTKSFCQFCHMTIVTGLHMFFLYIMFEIVEVVLYFRTHSQHQIFRLNGKSTGVEKIYSSVKKQVERVSRRHYSRSWPETESSSKRLRIATVTECHYEEHKEKTLTAIENPSDNRKSLTWLGLTYMWTNTVIFFLEKIRVPWCLRCCKEWCPVHTTLMSK